MDTGIDMGAKDPNPERPEAERMGIRRAPHAGRAERAHHGGGKGTVS